VSPESRPSLLYDCYWAHFIRDQRRG